MIERRKRNSSKVNLTISFIFHGCLIFAVFYFAAREGMLGKKMKEISAYMVKEKKVEAPKPKAEEPKVAQKPVETPKVAAAAPARVDNAPPPPVDNTPAVAPAQVIMSDMVFNDGAHEVSTGDPSAVYKGVVEHAIRSRWNRPEDIQDDNFVADVQLNVARDGSVTGYKWIKGSGNTRWDDSVKAAITATKRISNPPPKGFPENFIVRFDVATEAVDNVIQLGSR